MSSPQADFQATDMIIYTGPYDHITATTIKAPNKSTWSLRLAPPIYKRQFFPNDNARTVISYRALLLYTEGAFDEKLTLNVPTAKDVNLREESALFICSTTGEPITGYKTTGDIDPLPYANTDAKGNTIAITYIIRAIYTPPTEAYDDVYEYLYSDLSRSVAQKLSIATSYSTDAIFLYGEWNALRKLITLPNISIPIQYIRIDAAGVYLYNSEMIALHKEEAPWLWAVHDIAVRIETINAHRITSDPVLGIIYRCIGSPDCIQQVQAVTGRKHLFILPSLI